MGQTLSTSNAATTTASSTNRLTSQAGTLRQSLKRVHSEDLDEAKRTGSFSLPTSPSIVRRLGSSTESESPTSKASLTFESVLRNFEEFAQHQWPTWAKRRGWMTDISADSTSAGTSAATASSAPDDGSGRVVQVDKDKWVFQRHRKKGYPSVSPVEDVLMEESQAQQSQLDDSALERMATDMLQIDESRTSNGGLMGASQQGQRSRRSSGYASASSSPSAKRAADQLATALASSPPPALPAAMDAIDKTAVPEVTDEWHLSSNLYEVTLRYMFDGFDVVVDESAPVEEMLAGYQSVSKAPSIDAEQERPTSDPTAVIRVYLHLFNRQKNNRLPSFIDFWPMQNNDENDKGEDNVMPLGDDRLAYGLLFQDGNPAPQASFPREMACVELIGRIVKTHPGLADYEPGKLALYEKSWCPGKTSRARLRRLNDFDCPLLLAQQWRCSSSAAGDAGLNCAKTLVLQESQNGDIPWEDFTVAELSSFLRVLDREEANHEMQIRERYQLLNARLRQAMQLSTPPHPVANQC